MNTVSIDLNTLSNKIELNHEKQSNFAIHKGENVFLVPINDRNHYIIYPTSTKERKTKKIVIHLCKVNIRVFYEDYHNSLELYDIEILYPGREFLNIVNFNSINAVFFLSQDHRDELSLIPLNKDSSAVINFEQLFVYNQYASLRKIYDKKIQVIDYSAVHVEFMERAMHLPYQYNEKEVSLLKSLIRSQPKEYDVCMVANGTPHRIDIWNELKRRGVRVNHVTGWLLTRDIEIAKCRLLLNVHVDTEEVGYTIFEHLRCDRWMFAGMPIISETSRFDEDQKDLDLHGIMFHPYEELVDKVIEFLAKPQQTNQDDDNEKLELQAVVDARKSKMDKVLHRFVII